jgi:DNA polymerase
MPAVRSARPFTGTHAPGIQAMPFNDLADAASVCSACRLCETRRNVVFGTGLVSAHWMIVGDAPGELEDEQGKPLVGKPGQLLDNMLHACGMSRGAGPASNPIPPEKQVFVTNALKCRPKGSSNPTPEELASCEPYLLRQIELVRPSIVLAMGRYAVQALLHSTEPLGKLRGRVHRVHGGPDIPVIVTYHPAYLVRNGEDKARAWDDLCLAMETAGAWAPR